MLNRIIHFSLYNRIVVLILSGLILAGGCMRHLERDECV